MAFLVVSALWVRVLRWEWEERQQYQCDAMVQVNGEVHPLCSPSWPLCMYMYAVDGVGERATRRSRPAQHSSSSQLASSSSSLSHHRIIPSLRIASHRIASFPRPYSAGCSHLSLLAEKGPGRTCTSPRDEQRYREGHCIRIAPIRIAASCNSGSNGRHLFVLLPVKLKHNAARLDIKQSPQ